MCILPGEKFSEANLKANGAFDGQTVNTIVKAMTVYPDATFLGKNTKYTFHRFISRSSFKIFTSWVLRIVSKSHFHW